VARSGAANAARAGIRSRVCRAAPNAGGRESGVDADLAEVRGEDESELVGEWNEDDGASEDVPSEFGVCGDAGAEWPSYE